MGVGGKRHASAAFTPRKDPIPIVQEAEYCRKWLPQMFLSKEAWRHSITSPLTIGDYPSKILRLGTSVSVSWTVSPTQAIRCLAFGLIFDFMHYDIPCFLLHAVAEEDTISIFRAALYDLAHISFRHALRFISFFTLPQALFFSTAGASWMDLTLLPRNKTTETVSTQAALCIPCRFPK